jgi:hypothetical protein
MSTSRLVGIDVGLACSGGFGHVVRTVLDVSGGRDVFDGKELRGS